MAVAAKWCCLRKKCLLWLLVIVLWSYASAETREQRTREIGSVICELAPPWTAPVVNADGVVEEGEERNFILEGRGNVIAVALTSASSQHSLEQAEKLGALETYFHNNQMHDVKIILVNSAQSRDHLPDLLSKNLTITVFQETAHKPVWTKLSGKKDYVFVYDRCGKLTYKIPFPLSIIHPGQRLVETSIISTYEDNICGAHDCNSSNINPETGVNSDEVKKENNEDSNGDESRGAVGSEDSENEAENLGDEKLEQLFKSRKEGKPYTQEAPTTAKPSLLNGLWSLYRNIMDHMPWVSKKKDERHLNSVRRFLDQEKSEKNYVVSETEESQNDMCNITQKSICRAWSKKKLDHARICCNMHTCNRSTQYLQKHCLHYPEHRCKKVEQIVKCCHNDAENGSHTDEQANTSASVSSHPKS